MPEVSRFYGIIIRFYFRDHPPTHFHAIYAEHEALIEIETGRIYQGYLSRRWSKTKSVGLSILILAKSGCLGLSR